MKANTMIDDSLLNNTSDFNGDFYGRFKLRTDSEPLKLNASIAKNYLFPTFYGDVTCAIGIFLCSYKKAQDLLPHPNISPIRMGKGRSLVAFSCYIYRNVLGVAPYNEIAMTIPIMVDPLFNTPVLPMIASGLFRRFGYYCFSMPVTSLENQIRGEKIWGLPKVVNEINISGVDTMCDIEAKDSTGEAYFRLNVPMRGKKTHFDVSANLYTVKEKQLLQSATHFKGDFNVVKHMGRLFKKGGTPEHDYLVIGNSESGKLLRSLDIDPNPFQFRYAKTMSSCFDLPNSNYQSPIAL